VTVQIYSQKSNAWREAYNPLRGMNLLDAGDPPSPPSPKASEDKAWAVR